MKPSCCQRHHGCCLSPLSQLLPLPRSLGMGHNCDKLELDGSCLGSPGTGGAQQETLVPRRGLGGQLGKMKRGLAWGR